MKGDFSRIRFNPSRQYTAVLEQQGRLSVDADANEQAAIDDHLRRTTNRDVIGMYGGPEDDCGFAIEVQNDRILIGPGRYYVDGLLVEQPRLSTFDGQPYLIDMHSSSHDLLEQLVAAKGHATLQLTLEVWQRLATSLDDPCLLEPAIGQCDPTVRLQTISRVVARLVEATTAAASDTTAAATPGAAKPAPAAAAGATSATGNLIAKFGSAVLREPSRPPVSAFLSKADPSQSLSAASQSASAAGVIAIGQAHPNLSACCQSMYQPMRGASTGMLRVDLAASGEDCGCDPISTGGYRGLENQLYRIEIHTPGDLTQATFKWSRENASVVVAVVGVQGQVVNLSSLGPDVNLGFQPGQWVELSDDTNLFGVEPNQPGALYQIQSIDPASLSVTMNTVVLPVDPGRNARMRRWDQFGRTASASGLPLSAAPFALEYGIQVTFQEGMYASGDYWTFPARTASGQISWPPCGSNGSPFQPALSTKVFSAPLACIHLTQYYRRKLSAAEVRLQAEALLVQARKPTRQAPSPPTFQSYQPNFTVDDCRLTFPPLTRLSDAQPTALHITGTSWANDDSLTVDQLIMGGLSVVFDQAPDSPWSGGNFQLILEVPGLPFSTDSSFSQNVFSFKNPLLPFRQVLVLDPPEAITVSGTVVHWLAASTGNFGNRQVLFYFATMLNRLLLPGAQRGAFGRVRVRLISEGVYKSVQAGTIFLDGSAFAIEAGTAAAAPHISLGMPSGNNARAHDFQSWFYLAPTIGIENVRVTPAEIVVTVDWTGAKTGLTNPAGQAVTEVDAFVTLTYAPAADTEVTLILTGPDVGSVASVPNSATVSSGMRYVKVAISINSSPGAAKIDSFSLAASITTLSGVNESSPATFTVTGGPQPAEPIR